MADNADAVMQFLKEFTAEKLSPTSDDDVQIRCGIVGNYSLKPEEIDGEVTDWVLNYLEQRKCPYFLAVILAKEVAQQISTIVCKRFLQSNGENIGDEGTMLQNATSLHTEAISVLRKLCSELQDHPDETRKFEAPPLRFDASVFAIKNGRRKMEDRHVILHDLNTVCNLQNAPNHSYYAVFDGHAGVETASFASAHLHINMVQHPSFLKDTKTAIIEAFKLTDAQFAERATRENLKSGATAVCALIRESTLYIAWVGDSQAFLIKQGKPHAVMNPHKPEREDERKRIEELGGCIYHHGTWRVNGTLAVSRALGDAEHKPYVSCEPEINVITLDGSEDFLVIACDGLWDKMSPADVSVSLYRHLADNPQDVDGTAAKLVHQSKLMGSNDNITTIVVFLRDIPSLIADSPKYAAIFPQLEGINVSSISQIANGTAGKNFSEKEESSDPCLENKYQRPTYFHKDLDFSGLDPADWSPVPPGAHEIHDRNGKYGVAEGVPPEQTSLSELPTPPIDEVVASKQFSEYSTSEQLKIFQEHLESQGFHDVSLDEIQTSMTENLQFLPSEMQDDMGYLADDAQSEAIGAKETPNLPFEDLTDATRHFKSDLADTPVFTDISSTYLISDHKAQLITHQEVLNTASDLVLNTIETAVKQVSSGDSSAELSPVVQESFVSLNPFEKQDSDIVDSSLQTDSKSISPSLKSSHQLNPNAEPFVMKKDFASFNPDTMISSSPLQFVGARDLALLDISSLNEVLVDDGVVPVAMQGDASGDTDTVSSSSINSPLPSAPPLEALSEGQKTCASEEYVVHADMVPSHNNPFYSSLLENDGVDNKIPSALTEVSTAIQELETQFSVGLELESKPSGQELGSQLYSGLSLEDQLLIENSKPVDHPPPAQELVDLSPPSLKPLDQPPPSLESLNQLSPVQEPIEQPPLAQEPVDQPPPSWESLDYPPPAMESVDQPLPALESVDQPLPALESVDQLLPAQELVDLSLPAQELVDLPPPAQELVDLPPPAQEPADQPPLAQKPVDQTLPSHDLYSSDKGMLDNSYLDSANKSSSQLDEIQESLSVLSIAGSKDNSESKISVLATDSVGTEWSPSLNQTMLLEESSSVLEYSLDQITNSVQTNSLQQKSLGEVKASDNLINDASCAEDVTTQVTKQVIGLDSLLPEEVQAKLLEVTSTTLPSESVTEDAPVGAVAVDLKTIPDGVPEAEGVTEDMDSDSEKDGGWSYVKASNSSQEQKTVKKTVDANKTTSKKGVIASVKDRKAVSKTAGDTRSRPRGSISGMADATKKVAPEKSERKPLESKVKKDRPVTVSKIASPQPVASKTLTSDKKLIKKSTTTVPRSIPSKPSATSTTAATKQPASNITNKTASLPASKPQVGEPEKVIGKPAHSSTPFRPNLQKSGPLAATAKPSTRPASATASHSNVTSLSSASKQSGSIQKPQPRASSAPLASKTLPSTKVSATELKNVSAAPGAEVKSKPSGTTFRKPLPPALKKQDVKETKDTANKQILAKKTTQVSSASTTTTTTVRRTGASTSAPRVDPLSKKSGSAAATSDKKTLKMSAGRTDVAKSSTTAKTSTARGRVPLQSKQLSKSVKSDSDKKPSEAKQSKNGPKVIVSDTSSSDQKCSPDNRMQEVNDEKGMLEVNAQETADDKSAGAGVDPLIDVPASEIVSKSELKQETNVVECPVSVTPAEEEKV